MIVGVALLVAVPALIWLLLPPAHAPRHVAPLPDPPALQPQTDLDPADPQSEPETAQPDTADRPKEDTPQAEEAAANAVTFRIIDAATSQPVANTPLCLAWLEWHGIEAAIDTIDEHDSDTRTSETGEVDQHLEAEDFRDHNQPIYPLPQNYLPVTPATEIWLAIEAALREDNPAPVIVRVERCPALTVRCINEQGKPLAGITVCVYPDSVDRHALRLFPDDQPASLDDSGPIEPTPPPSQTGAGAPDAVSFEFRSPDHSAGPAIIPANATPWDAVTDSTGGVRFEGMENMRWNVVAFGPGAAVQEQAVKLSGDGEIVFTFTAAAELELRIVYLDAEPLHADDWHIVSFAGGTLDVSHGGHGEVSLNIRTIAPGAYALDPEPDGPTQFVVLKPGYNQATLWLGESAWSEWRCQATVNGKPLDSVNLPWIAKGAQRPAYEGHSGPDIDSDYEMHGIAEFYAEEQVKMAPGTYIVSFPDGRKQEITFHPGMAEYTRLDLKGREVTFTIARDLAEVLAPQEEVGVGLPISISIGESWDFDDPSLQLIGALFRSEREMQRGFAPDSPMKRAMPPGMYSVGVDLRSGFGRLHGPLDLRDPSLTHVEFSLAGWPGAGAYVVRVDSDAQDGGMPMHSGDIWDRFGSNLPGFETDELLITGRTTGLPLYGDTGRTVWLPRPGRYDLRAETTAGRCSVRLTGHGAHEGTDAWVRWQRGGVEFIADVDKDLGAQRLPAGNAHLVVVRRRWLGTANDPQFDCAVLDVALAGEHVVRLPDLQWQKCGEILVRSPRSLNASIEIHTPSYTWLGDNRLRRDMAELQSPPLPPGAYRIFVRVPGRPLEIKTARVEPGRTTVIDVR